MEKPKGIEKCGTFFSEAAGRKLLEYDFQTEDGDLFSTVTLTLAEARSKRDAWLSAKKKAAKNSIMLPKSEGDCPLQLQDDLSIHPPRRMIVENLETKLQERFEFVRYVFFPEWGLDEVELGTFEDRSGGLRAECDCKRNRIWINKKELGKPIVTPGLLIHEMCHLGAVYGNHGKEFQKQMLRAAKQAEKFGLRALARWLRREVECLQADPIVGNEETAFNEIRDCLDHELDFNSMVSRVAERCGCTWADVISSAPLRRVTDEYKPERRRRISARLLEQTRKVLRAQESGDTHPAESTDPEIPP